MNHEFSNVNAGQLYAEKAEKQVGNRIVVVGTSGSGKTTLAKQIAQQLQIPHVELDALNWEPNWIEAPIDIFRSRVAEATSGDRWVVDGNYSRIRDLVWSRADTVVWLDYPLPLVLRRIIGRTVWRGVSQVELWNGNRETLQKAFSKDSMILWVLKTYHRKRRDYPLLFQRSDYQHLTIVHLQSQQQTNQWLSNLPN